MCLTPPVQCDLFAGDGTLNTADDNIHNRRTDLQLRLNDISDGVVEIRWYSIQPKQNAWRQKHPKQQLLQFKLRDHANSAGFKASPTWSNCRQADKVANAYL